MKVEYRFTQPLLSLGMILIVLIFCCILLLLFPLIFLGGLFWDEQRFWNENNWYFKLIPKLLEKDEKDEKNG